MHPTFAITTTRVLWALCFASHLVLLVVLLGRDRIKRFPLFTASIVLMTLRLLFEMLLVGRLPMIPLQSVLLTTANLSELLTLLVLIEIARQCFPGAKARAWSTLTPALVAVSAAALSWWGPWPKPADLAVHTQIDLLRLLQFVWQKSEVLLALLTLCLGLTVLIAGRRFRAGWRNHSNAILLGLVILAAVWLGMTGFWQVLSHRVTMGLTREEYQRILNLGTILYNGYRVSVIVVAVWWIVGLWIEEPGVKPASASAAPAPLEAVAESSEATLTEPKATPAEEVKSAVSEEKIPETKPAE